MNGLYFKRLQNSKVQCILCPHNCLIDLNKFGVCKVRHNLDGELKILNYCSIAAFNIDPIEKKPLYHYFPGTKTLSIACNGCNFKCLNCQNHSISQHSSVNSIEITPEQIVEKALNSGTDLITFTYTEPTIFYEFMLETAEIAHKYNLKNAVVSNGYINNQPLMELIPFISAANIDLKFASNTNYKKIAGGEVEYVVKTIETLFNNNIITEVTTLIIPGINDSLKEFSQISDLILNISDLIPWHISAFYPTYKMLNYPPTASETLIQLRNHAINKGHKYVYTGNIINHEGESTFCPNCNKLIVERGRLNLLTNNIKNGICPYCKTKIYGLWE